MMSLGSIFEGVDGLENYKHRPRQCLCHSQIWITASDKVLYPAFKLITRSAAEMNASSRLYLLKMKAEALTAVLNPPHGHHDVIIKQGYIPTFI